MYMSFFRQIEDFQCEHCGVAVAGNGYTNHCPKCLWSRHVDVNPGDRAAECGGAMQPISVERKGDEWIITHRCVKCSHAKRNVMGSEDDFDVVTDIAAKPNF